MRRLDYMSVVRRVLRRLRPSVGVVMETEIWPHLYRESKRAGASLVVVTVAFRIGRWGGYRGLSGLFRQVLRWPDTILVQSGQDAARYVDGRRSRGSTRSAGNLKV